MNEQEKLFSENQLSQLKKEIKEEIEAELLQKRDSGRSFNLYQPNLDVALIWIGFLLFILCLFMPAFNFVNPFVGDHSPSGGTMRGIDAARGAFSEFFSSLRIFSIAFYGSVSTGNILILLSPLLLFFRQPKFVMIFATIFWIFCVNAAISIFILSNAFENAVLTPHIGYYIWVIAFALTSLGYLLRYIRLCTPDLIFLVPLISSFVSITLLLPGIALPALSLEGTVYKAKAFESSKSMIIDAFVSKTKDEASKNGKEVTDNELSSVRDTMSGQIDEILKALGFGHEAIQGTIKVYDEKRSILTAVKELYQAGYGFVALLVILFSVVTPVLKAGLIVAYSVTKKPIYQSIANTLSKWSMADVFAMAIIIACLAANSYEFKGLLQMNAKLEVGFYFFVAYCLLSVASSQVKINQVRLN